MVGFGGVLAHLEYTPLIVSPVLAVGIKVGIPQTKKCLINEKIDVI